MAHREGSIVVLDASSIAELNPSPSPPLLANPRNSVSSVSSHLKPDPVAMSQLLPFPSHHLPVDQLRPGRRISSSTLNPQPLPLPLPLDALPSTPAPTEPHNPPNPSSLDTSPTSSHSSADSFPPTDIVVKREDRQLASSSIQSRPPCSTNVHRLSGAVTRRGDPRNRPTVAKRLRAASDAHSGSTGSLVDLATRTNVETLNEANLVMARTHRRRASESTGFFAAQRSKRTYAQHYLPLPSTGGNGSRRRQPLALTDFSLKKVLGSGGTATVIRAEPVRGSNAAAVIPADEVALKAVSKKGLSRRAQHYLNREIHIHRQVQSHPHIASMYEVFQDSSAVYLALELLRGGDLYSVLRRERRGLSEIVALTIMWQILDALQYMHSLGYAHRDVKPENIMFAERPVLSSGRVPCVKLVDLGLASARDPKAPVKDRLSSEKCGTLRYAAPEIVTEASYLPERCDIWSVGIVLYSIIAHRNPYTGRTEKEVLGEILNTPLSFEGPDWSRVSDDTKSFIKACLTRKPSDRPSARSAFETVDRILRNISKSSRLPTRGANSDGQRKKGDVSGFSSHVTPDRNSPVRNEDGPRNGNSSPSSSTGSNSDGNSEQPANFFDGLIRALFSGGSSPDRARNGSANSN